MVGHGQRQLLELDPAFSDQSGEKLGCVADLKLTRIILTPGLIAGRTGKDDSATAAHLAIPSYDSLSASQVVQRLAGLSRDEVEAVRAYEAATRGRRTILARAEQLLA